MYHPFLKKILLIFVPFLVLALTPVDFRYCKGMMANCKGCPMMEAKNPVTAQMSAAQRPCCGIYHWQGLAFNMPIQKAGDLGNGRLPPTIQALSSFNNFLSAQTSFQRSFLPLSPYTPTSTVVLKQSFLI